ncbi:MAG: putative porin, partial [Acidobacteriota bacterium]|nr:putative porin [Acidobacteriota bacterium]
MKTNLRVLFLLLSFYITHSAVMAQSPSPTQESNSASSSATPAAQAPDIEEVRRQLREQQKQIEQLRSMLSQQSKIIEGLQSNAAQTTPTTTQAPTVSTQDANVAASPQTDTIESRLGNIEEQSKRTTDATARNQLGTLGFSGEIRMQYDSIYGLLNNAPNVNDPAIIGNDLSSRQRLRYRLRFAVRGKIGGDVFSGAYAANGEQRTEREFEWGIRFAAGSLANPASANQILTDFFSRKPIALDQVYVAWRPRPVPGLRIIAGKFEPTWTRTEMTIDNDLQVEGVSEVYSRDIRDSFVKNVTFSLWQLPMLERGTSFVRNANGTVNIEESRRAGQDLAMFGAQLQTRFALSPNTNLTLAAANLHYANTDAINPIQVFGANLQLPVTITIPATVTTPSQTVTGVATIARDALVSGNSNLGLSVATNAAVNRDGRLASGFNLVNLLAQLELKQYKYNPMTFIFDYVRNT